MSEIRIQRTTEIVADDFTVSDESKLKGTLIFIDEHDDTNDLIYVNIGTVQIGWIPKRNLLDLAQVFLKEFALVVPITMQSPEMPDTNMSTKKGSGSRPRRGSGGSLDNSASTSNRQEMPKEESK